MTDNAHDTPEEAVLAEWDRYPNANARIVEVRYKDADHAVVVTETDPSYPMWNYVCRTIAGWVLTDDHN